MERCCCCRYVASTDDSSLVARVLRQTDSETLDFVTSPGPMAPRHVTSSARYDKHDVIADLGGPAEPALIPTPLSVRRRQPEVWVEVATTWTVLYQPQLAHEARLLVGQWMPRSAVSWRPMLFVCISPSYIVAISDIFVDIF